MMIHISPLIVRCMEKSKVCEALLATSLGCQLGRGVGLGVGVGVGLGVGGDTSGMSSTLIVDNTA